MFVVAATSIRRGHTIPIDASSGCIMLDITSQEDRADRNKQNEHFLNHISPFRAIINITPTARVLIEKAEEHIVMEDV